MIVLRLISMLLAALFVTGTNAVLPLPARPVAVRESVAPLDSFCSEGEAIRLTNIPEEEIRSIVFLASVEGAPDAAEEIGEDVTLEGILDGPVLCWAQPRADGGYMAFYAAEGGMRYTDNILEVGMPNLEELYFNGSLDTYDVEYMWFNDMPELRVLDLSGVDTSNIRDMGCMFDGCESLTSLDLSGFDTSKAEDMFSMFYGCESLTSLDLSGFDTSKVEDMSWMFSGCTNLALLNLEGFDTSNVWDMSCMFDGCASIETLDLSSFDTGEVLYMYSMFEDCSNLTEIFVGERFQLIDEEANVFAGCGTDHLTLLQAA